MRVCSATRITHQGTTRWRSGKPRACWLVPNYHSLFSLPCSLSCCSNRCVTLRRRKLQRARCKSCIRAMATHCPTSRAPSYLVLPHQAQALALTVRPRLLLPQVVGLRLCHFRRARSTCASSLADSARAVTRSTWSTWHHPCEARPHRLRGWISPCRRHHKKTWFLTRETLSICS